MIWPKVFHRNDKFGKEIAVILMDTQGTFDLNSEIGNAALIFAISLLMSSVQIFNTKSQIDAQDLDALNTFITFCQKADEKVGQNFLIMVRDAIRAGLDNEYIDELKAQSHQAPTLKNLLNGVLDSFEKVECFMVPRPAEEVLRASGEVPVKDCGHDFLLNLCACANHVLENLVPKNVMGTTLTGETLKAHVENLVHHVTHNHHRAIGSAYLATSQLYFHKAQVDAESVFNDLHEKLIRENGHHPIKPELYAEELNKIIDEAVKVYLVSSFFGSTQEKRSHFNDFEKGLKDRCLEKTENNENRYRDIGISQAVNGAYEVYEKEIKPDITEALTNPRDLALLTARHNQASAQAMDYFEKAAAEFAKEAQLVEIKRKLLLNMIKAKFDDLSRENGIINLERKSKEILEKLLEEHISNLTECISTTTNDEEILLSLRRCTEKLQSLYETKKRELTLEVMNTLPTVSPQTILQILDNNRQAFATPFKKCEDDFISQVRDNMRMKELTEKVREVEQLRLNENQRFGAHQAETEAKLEQMRDFFAEEQRQRLEAESKNRNHETMMLLMNYMKENNNRQQEQYDQERRENTIREERQNQEAQEKVDRVWQQRAYQENERKDQARWDKMEKEQQERQAWNERQQPLAQEQQQHVLENQPANEDPGPNGAPPIAQVAYFAFRILRSLGI